MKYRRKRATQVWHWCINCGDWPLYDYEEIELPAGQRPLTGELHDECESKEQAGNCEASRA